VTIFKKIVDGEVPCDLIYEAPSYVAFHDINPQAPVHFLVVPRTDRLENLKSTVVGDAVLLGILLRAAAKIAREQGLEDFTVTINNGPGAGQTVPHLHLHVTGTPQ